MNPVRIHEGAGPFTTELLLWNCAMLQWREMDSLQLLTLYLAPTPIFSGRKAKINLHTTPKWTVVIPIGCLLPCAVPEIFVMGGGGVHVNLTKKNTLWQRCLFFFAFFLVLGLSYRSQMVNFKEKYHFSRLRRGSKFFQGGGGGGGGNCLLPIETQITCDFPGGSGPPCPSPLDPHLAAIYLVSQSAKWCDRLLACTCDRFPATSLYVFSQAPQ